MTYASWQPRHRVTTIKPGKLDLLVVTLIDGKHANIEAVTEYDAALRKADAFVRTHPCQIKVLPLTGLEARNLLEIKLPEHPEPLDAALRQHFVTTLKDIARDSNDSDARTDALALLTDMGVIVA